MPVGPSCLPRGLFGHRSRLNSVAQGVRSRPCLSASSLTFPATQPCFRATSAASLLGVTKRCVTVKRKTRLSRDVASSTVPNTKRVCVRVCIRLGPCVPDRGLYSALADDEKHRGVPLARACSADWRPFRICSGYLLDASWCVAAAASALP